MVPLVLLQESRLEAELLDELRLLELLELELMLRLEFELELKLELSTELLVELLRLLELRLIVELELDERGVVVSGVVVLPPPPPPQAHNSETVARNAIGFNIGFPKVRWNSSSNVFVIIVLMKLADSSGNHFLLHW
jgi:hypothetical protein